MKAELKAQVIHEAVSEAVKSLYTVYALCEMKNHIKATVEIEGESFDISFQPTPKTNTDTKKNQQ